ncbi:hypothetical protein QUA42_05895 [Microcoleus sp. Pol11C2]|uniref:hypothetical protein n=1 Tax=Microcoleus sp. Pol11C2 TaxID=3055389 RepID=UPI002FCF5836
MFIGFLLITTRLFPFSGTAGDRARVCPASAGGALGLALGLALPVESSSKLL